MSDEEQRSTSRDEKEKTRLCPTCRCAISILATKCRFCGETVGRPKDETRSLSIQDLGGETVVHYAPSSNVMEALEAFRMEEGAPPPPPQKKGLFSRKSTSTTSDSGLKSDPGVLEMDERGKALASLMVPSRPTPQPHKAHGSHDPGWMKKLAFLGGFVALIVILYFGSIQAAAMIRGWNASDEGPSHYVNPARRMMEEGAPALEVHKAALLAVQKEDTPQNREILSEARSQVINQVRALLQSQTVSLRDLTDASNLATQAWQEDRSPEMQELKKETDAENQAFAMSLVEVNGTSPKTAVIRLASRSTVTVKQGDMIGDRFQVQSVTDQYVRLLDTKRTTASGMARGLQVSAQGISK